MNRTVADFIQPDLDILSGRPAFVGSFLDRLGATFVAYAARIQEMRRIQTDLNYLRSCDDRMLADIGLSRSQIDYAVRSGRLS